MSYEGSVTKHKLVPATCIVVRLNFEICHLFTVPLEYKRFVTVRIISKYLYINIIFMKQQFTTFLENRTYLLGPYELKLQVDLAKIDEYQFNWLVLITRKITAK